jgi:hypothetical protein
MRRDHHRQHEHEDPLVSHLDTQYGGRVPHGLIEACVSTLCSDPSPGQDRLSSEHLARAEVASLAARGRSTGGRGRG